MNKKIARALLRINFYLIIVKPWKISLMKNDGVGNYLHNSILSSMKFIVL
jgi:hypothetical protein